MALLQRRIRHLIVPRLAERATQISSMSLFRSHPTIPKAFKRRPYSQQRGP
jgi:hypothetical protein